MVHNDSTYVLTLPRLVGAQRAQIARPLRLGQDMSVLDTCVPWGRGKGNNPSPSMLLLLCSNRVLLSGLCPRVRDRWKSKHKPRSMWMKLPSHTLRIIETKRNCTRGGVNVLKSQDIGANNHYFLRGYYFQFYFISHMLWTCNLLVWVNSKGACITCNSKLPIILYLVVLQRCPMAFLIPYISLSPFIIFCRHVFRIPYHLFARILLLQHITYPPPHCGIANFEMNMYTLNGKIVQPSIWGLSQWL